MKYTEATPVHGQTPMEMVLDSLGRVEEAGARQEIMTGRITNEVMGIRADMQSLLSRVGVLEIRVGALELAGRYFPFIFSGVALVEGTIALIMVLRGHR